jgi:hypothetical protein
MTLHVVVLDAAALELSEAAAWYERERPELGGDFIAAYENIVAHALEFPQTGSRVGKLAPDLEVRRFTFERFPYDLVTMQLAQSLIVITVAHQHRKPGYWRRRLTKLLR